METDSDYHLKATNGSLLPAIKRLIESKSVTKELNGTYKIALEVKKLLQAEITTYIKLVYLSRQRVL